MAQVLSQDEIDALLGGLDDVAESPEQKDSATQEIAEAQDVIPYDFANAAKMSKIKFPGFAVINDQFNRGLRATLSSILRVMVESTVVPIEIVTFSDFLKRIPVPASLHVLKMEPLKHNILMVIDPQLVFSIVEIFLGSTRLGQSRVEGREFTSIEQRLIRRIVNSFLKDWEHAWQNVYPVKFLYIRSEINPQFAKIISDEDSVIIAKFQLDIEELTGFIFICIPMSAIQPIKQKLQTSYQPEENEDPEWRDALLRNVRDIAVEIIVSLGTTALTGSEILDLEAGDIIQLDTRIDDRLTASVMKRPKFRGIPGIHRGQKAFRIDQILGHEE